MKKMYFNQYQIESAETERYADNQRLVANTLGLLGEVGELVEDVLNIIKAEEIASNISLPKLKRQLLVASLICEKCGEVEKSIRKNHVLGEDIFSDEEETFKNLILHPSPEAIEHLEGEAGDCLFHLSRLLASVNADLEHCAIKNRMKLTKRLRNNEITDHKDH